MLANQSIDFVLDISLANMHLPFAIQGAALQLHEVRLKLSFINGPTSVL